VTEEINSAPRETTTGTRIAGYQIEAEIGRGGMAIVYRALDVKLSRLVALKILAPQLAEDESFRRRFMHESQAAAAVDHPHIVPVFEAGEAGDALFIAMRYVGTGDVRTLLERQGRLPVARAVAITAQVASALDAAHARGLVHRDVKPANMLLAESGDGRADHVYLSDFGLSKQSLAPTGLTSTGQFLGTLDYVAPEQIEGRAVDGRADLYALACATMEMLTGAPPFRREENLALMWAQLSEPPPRVSERRPDLPLALDQVIGRALAKTPDERYRSCMDFAAALREATTAQPGGPAGAAGAAAAGRPAAGSGGGGMLWPQTEVSRRAARGPTSADPVPTSLGPVQPATPGVPAQAGYAGYAVAPGSPGAPATPPTPGSPPTPDPSPWSPAYSPSRAAPSPSGAAPPASVPPPVAPGSGPPGWSSSAAPAGPPAPSDLWGPDGSLWRPATSQPASSQWGGSAGPSGPTDWLGPQAGPAGPTVPPGTMPQAGRRTGGRRRGPGLAIAASVVVVACLAAAGYELTHRQAGGGSSSDGQPAVVATTPATSAPATAEPPAARTVLAYFAALNHQRYARAWKLGGENTVNESFAKFRNGYSATAHDAVQIVSVEGDVVTAKLTATQTDGTTRTFAGTYTVVGHEIMSADVHLVS
jgi:serine/threonine protein kinase